MAKAGNFSTMSVAGQFVLFTGTSHIINYVSMNIALKVCAPGSVIITVTTYGLSARYHPLYITLLIFNSNIK